jgi:hypothetical protein
MIITFVLAIITFVIYTLYKRNLERELDREAQEALDAVRAARSEVDAATKGVEDAKIDYKTAEDAYRRKYHSGSDDERKG